MIIEVHEFLGNFWGFRSRRFVTMKPIKSLRLALALQYQGQDSFEGCHLKTLSQLKVLLLSALLVPFNNGACSDVGPPRDHIAAPPELYSQLEAQ
jgi:hypothetical protein